MCAKVCHKGHELSYSKCGSFFCDCGAKEDKSCQALVKRGAGTAGGSGKATSASDDSQSFAVPFASSTMKKTKKGNIQLTSTYNFNQSLGYYHACICLSLCLCLSVYT